MSEKFVVGQWVTRKGVNWKVKEVRMEGDTLLLEGYGGAYVDDCFPFGWTPGHTYRTTLDGVTATVASTECGKLYGGDSRSKRYAWGWSGLTGLLLGMEKAIEGPHLLPYLADEPPPVAEAATYGEFAEADECDDVNHPPHYTQHPSGVECITITEAFNFNVGNAIKYLWRAGLKGDALEDMRKAAWYVQREIERTERIGK